MICSAIEQLNEEGGSGEEAISDFIKKNNDDLPWAHNLSELCKCGEIVEFRDKCYLLGDSTTRIDPTSSPSPSPTSSVPASPNVSLSSSSISYSSSCSSSNSEFCLKRKQRKRGRPRKRRARGEQTNVRHTKASTKRRGRPKKKNPVSSEEYESDEQSAEDNNEIERELYEQEDQANKHGKRKRKASIKTVPGKETLAMVLWKLGKERGRPRRKLMFEKMQREAPKVEECKIDTADTKNHQSEEQNQVSQEQNEVLGRQSEINDQSQVGTNNENIVEEELL